MDKRKLILFGTNSYIISLPKSWIDKNDLKKGDYINLEETDGDLIINCNNNKEIQIESIEINLENKEIDLISTEIITSYLRGFDEIILFGNNLSKIISDLRKIIMKLPGVEVMDLTSDKMKIKNLLNEEGVSLEEILLRTNNMLISMINDGIRCFEEDIHNSVIERDNDINRMVFLSFRVLRKALKNKDFAKKLNLTPDKIIMFWQVFLRLEKIGDQNKRLARIIGNNEIKNKSEIKEIYIDLKNQYVDLFNYYNKKDTKKLLFIASKGKISIINKTDDYIKKNNDYITFKIIENYKNMSVSIEQIAQILLTVV